MMVDGGDDDDDNVWVAALRVCVGGPVRRT